MQNAVSMEKSNSLCSTIILPHLFQMVKLYHINCWQKQTKLILHLLNHGLNCISLTLEEIMAVSQKMLSSTEM